MEDLQVVYATVLIDMFSTWKKDSSESIYEQCYLFNNRIYVKFRPEEDHARIFLYPTEDSGIVLTDSFYQTLLPLLQEVENIFIQSYNKFVRKYGFWITESQEPITFKSILQASETLTRRGDYLTFHYKMPDYTNLPFTDWVPLRLLNWLRSHPNYREYLYTIRDRELRILEQTTKLYYQIMNELTSEQLIEIPPPSITDSTLTLQFIEHYINTIDIPETNFFTGSIQTIKKWIKDKEIPRRYPLSLQDAFPDREILKPQIQVFFILSGRKRNASEAGI